MDARQFLEALYRDADGYAELRLLHKSGDWKLAQKIYRPASEMHLGNFEALAEVNHEYHIYHRVNISSTTNSKKENISQITALYLDIDDSSDEAYYQLENMQLPPTGIVFSGGGFHGYWFLRKPMRLYNQDNIFEVERTMQGMILAYGEGADVKAKDITRILRTPSFYNIKDSYEIPPLCEVVYLDDDSFGRYGFHELYKVYAPLGTPKQPVIKRKIPQAAITKSIPNRVKNYLKHGASVGKRNHELFYCARAYNDAGYSESEALAELGSVARSDGLSDGEIKQCIRSAYAYSPNPMTALPRHMKNFMAVEDGVR